MIEISVGRKPWQIKAGKSGLTCYCWTCLRKAGFTPDHKADPRHRFTILGQEGIKTVAK